MWIVDIASRQTLTSVEHADAPMEHSRQPRGIVTMRTVQNITRTHRDVTAILSDRDGFVNLTVWKI